MADSQIDPGLATGPTLAVGSRMPAVDSAAEQLPDRLVEGDAVGDYVIERFLGAGAMGDVYAGRHPVIGKRVAVKVLKRELASDKEASERFIREAKAVNQIDHPNVIDVFNFGQLKGNDGRLFLVMDLVDGVSLRKALEDGPLEVTAALDILDKVADALDAAHARGVIHRDLKPDNVMLSSSTPPKVFVLDFGIAKLFTGTAIGNGTLTGKGTWLGTPGYMAPEQWSAEGASPASDRYALGVMAYELLSGVLPFKAPTLPQMMEQHFRSPVPALSKKGAASKPPEHHQTLDPVLARAMAKNPDERFPSAKALIEALRAASQGRKVVAPVKRSLTMPAIAGVSVLGLGIVGAFMIRDPKDDSDTRERPNIALPSPTDHKAKISLQVITRPPDALVMRDGVRLGQTPLEVEVDAGAKATLTISKAGYRSISDAIAFDKPVAITKDLQPILGFEGVWAMPDGKLRGFWRTGTDKIEVYRLESVTGERELWRTCALTPGPAGRDLVMFTTTAEMTDERAHAGDAGCSNPHTIEYAFDPAEESLAVRVERIETTRRNGHCEIVSKTWGQQKKLTRADRGGETRITEPPVGVPEKNIKGDKVPNDSVDKELDRGKPVFDGGKKPVKPAVPKQAPSKPTPKSLSKEDLIDQKKQQESLGNQPGKIDVVPNAPAPQQNPEPQAPSKKTKAPPIQPPIKKSEAPNRAPPQAQAKPLNGDSQAAK